MRFTGSTMQSIGSTQEVYRKYTRRAQEAYKRSTGSHRRPTSCTQKDHRKSQKVYKLYTTTCTQEVYMLSK